MLKSVGLGFCNVIALYVKLLCKGTLQPKLRISELPLADVSLPHDPIMPGVKLGSHLLPNHLAFMKEVSDVLTQRELEGGCRQRASSIIYVGCVNHFPRLLLSSMEGLGSATRPAQLGLKCCRNPSKSGKAV